MVDFWSKWVRIPFSLHYVSIELCLCVLFICVYSRHHRGTNPAQRVRSCAQAFSTLAATATSATACRMTVRGKCVRNKQRCLRFLLSQKILQALQKDWNFTKHGRRSINVDFSILLITIQVMFSTRIQFWRNGMVTDVVVFKPLTL